MYFPDRLRVDGVSFPTNTITPNDPIMKVWEYEMVVCLMKVPDPKFPFFSRLNKFQQFKRIHWILISPGSSTKISYNRCLCVEVHSALIECEKEKLSQPIIWFN